MDLTLILLLNALLVACGLVMVRAREMFTLIIVLSVFSGLLLSVFSILGAVDVAFTEVVVGVSMSTVLFVLLLERLGRSQMILSKKPPAHRLQSLALSLAVGAVFVWGVLALPDFGDPDSVMQQHVARDYLERSLPEMQTPNVVTAVLADYRGLDTLIETAVVLAAALGCFLIMGGMGRREKSAQDEEPIFNSVMLNTLMVPLTIMAQLFAIYVVIHGHYSPGGGFQGGVLLAASFILPLLVDYPGRSFPTLSPRGSLVLAAIGVAVFTIFAVVPMVNGGDMLDYSALVPGLQGSAAQRSLAILGIEIGVMLGVAGSMVSIYHSLRIASPSKRQSEGGAKA